MGSVNVLIEGSFDLLANIPVISVPVKAWRPRIAANLSFPRLSFASLTAIVDVLPKKTFHWEDLHKLLSVGAKYLCPQQNKYMSIFVNCRCM